MSYIITILGFAMQVGICILMICSWWFIYDKMGEKGWVSLIPFYGRYILFKRVWEGKIYLISLAFNTIALFFCGKLIFQNLPFSMRFLSFAGNVGGDAVVIGGIGLFLFAVIFAFISSVIQMMLNWRMVKCFGHGIGYFFGVTFMPIIIMPMLAYGRSYYDYY